MNAKRIFLCGSLLWVVWIVSVPAFARRDRAPGLELKDLSGQRHKLADLRGQIVLVSFWATWCAPCREEMPRLNAIRSAYQDRPVRVIAVSIDGPKDRDKVRPYLDQQHLDLEVWVGGDTSDLERFGLRNIVPGTVILNQDGEILSHILGEATESDIRGPIDWLLNKGSGPPPVAFVKRY